MLDKCFESLKSKGVQLGLEFAYDLDLLHDKYGMVYQGDYKQFDAWLKTYPDMHPAFKNRVYSIGGFIENIKALVPTGESCESNSQNIVDLKHFLDGGWFRVSGNYVYFKAQEYFFPNIEDVKRAVAFIFSHSNKFMKFVPMVDECFKCDCRIDSRNFEIVKESSNCYKVNFDLKIRNRLPVVSELYDIYENDILVEPSKKFFSILRLFFEKPEFFEFKNDGSKSYFVSHHPDMSLASFRSECHTAIFNKTELCVFDLVDLLKQFSMDRDVVDKLSNLKKIGAEVFAGYGGRNLFFEEEVLLPGRDDELVELRYHITTYFSVFNPEFYNNLLLMRKRLVELLHSPAKDSAVKKEQLVCCLEINLCGRIWMMRSGDLVYFEDMAKKPYIFLDCISTLIEWIEGHKNFFDEDGSFNFKQLIYYVHNMVQDAIRLDPIMYLELEENTPWSKELQNYARNLICGEF